jgi:hypothetical protein
MENSLLTDLTVFGKEKGNFIVWCWEKTKLAVSTVRAYLGVLKQIKMLVSCLENEAGDLERTLLRGMENLRMGKTKTRSDAVPVTLDTLYKIKKGLSGFKEKLTGQTIWTCCLVAFWGAFRLGELLGKSELKFDKFSDLLWENVVLERDTAIIHVKSPKTGGTRGALATLFEIPDEGLCPVRALRRLKASQGNLGLGESHLPVFRKSCGKFLTKGGFLDQINRVLERHSIGLTGKAFGRVFPRHWKISLSFSRNPT